MTTSTLPEPAPIERVRRARTARRGILVVFAVILLLGALNLFGVRTAQVSARGDGYTLTVTYARMTRPGLATPWSVEVVHPGGFSAPVTIATTADYIALFDQNAISPEPAGSTYRDGLVLWEFEPPPGDTLRVDLDARLEPAVQWGRDAETVLLTEGERVASVRYSTGVMP